MALQFHLPFMRYKFQYDGSDVGRKERTIYIKTPSATEMTMPDSPTAMNNYINPLFVLSGISAEDFAERVIDSSKKIEAVSNAVDI